MKKFKVIVDLTDQMGLKIGDIVTLVEGSNDNDLYELPERLHGKGHDGSLFDSHLNLRFYNYVYLYKDYIQEINDDIISKNIIKAINIFSERFPEYEILNVKLWDQTEHYDSYKIYARSYDDTLIEVINIEK